MKPLLALLLLCLATTAHTSELPAGFRWLREMVDGTWEGRFPDGKTVHTQTYTTQFGHFLRGTASLSGDHQGKAVTSFAGDSVFAWDTNSNKIVYYIWGSDGNHSREEAYFENERLIFPVYSKKEPGTLRFRSAWTRLGPDAVRVDREVPDGAGWKISLSVNYRRLKSAGSDSAASAGAASSRATNRPAQPPAVPR